MATAVIGMSLHRYVLKMCFKISEYNASLTFEGKGLKYFWNMYRAIYCAPGDWFSRTIKHSTFLLVTISWISDLCPFLGGFCHSGPLLLWESYIFVQRRQFLPSISLSLGQIDYRCWASQCSLLLFVHFPVKAIFLNKHTVEMFYEFLFSLGDFNPYTMLSLIFLVHWQSSPNFAHRGRIRKGSNFDLIFGETNTIRSSYVSPFSKLHFF